MKKQRWLVLLLVLVLVLSAGVLAACQPEPEPEPQVKEYTITFIADGKVVHTVKVKEGEAVTFPAVPAKEGYKGEWKPASIPAANADVTVNAVYTKIDPGVEEPKEYITLSFNTMGGDAMEAVKVEKGKAATMPANPVRKGYTFAGWYTDKALNFEFDFDTVLDSDLVLYAAWTINSYVVTVPSDYQNTINYVEFKTFDAQNKTQLFIKEGSTYKAIKSGDEVAYGTEVYFLVNKNEEADTNKHAVVYANGIELERKTAAEAFGVAGYTVTEYYSVTVTEDINITAKTAYLVTFNPNGGTGTAKKVAVENGKVVLPQPFTKAGYTFVGWSTEAGDAQLKKEFVNEDIAGSITVYAIYKINEYNVTAKTNVQGVVLELGKTVAKYGEIVGLRVIDNRDDKNDDVPLLLRVNGEMFFIEGDADEAIMMVGSEPVKDKVFDIQIFEDTELTITEEYRFTGYQFKFDKLNEHVKAYNYAQPANNAFFTTHLQVVGGDVITSTATSRYMVAGDQIVFYIWVEEGYSVALDTDEDYANWKIEPAKAYADIAAVTDADHNFAKVAKGGAMTNKFKVTITLPEKGVKDADTYILDLNNAFVVTANTYQIKGMNVQNSDYILRQGYIDSKDEVIKFYTDRDIVSSFTVDDIDDDKTYYSENIVFIKLANDKNYQVMMNGIEILDTVEDKPNAIWINEAGEEVKAWFIDTKGEDLDLEDAFCDQVWTLVEYKQVEITLNGAKYETDIVAVGDIWALTIASDYVVKINGKVQSGVAVSATTVKYSYHVLANTKVEIFQKYKIKLHRPEGDKDATVSNMTLEALYGEPVSVTIVPNTYTGYIMVAKAEAGAANIFLSHKNNVYTFIAGKDIGETSDEVDEAAEDNTITIKYQYTNEYVIVVYDEQDSSKDAYAPIEGIDEITDPTKAGYVFKGWIVQTWNAAQSKYDARPDDTDAEPDIAELDINKFDKVIAVYAAIKPVVKIENYTEVYDVEFVKVDGATIYASGTGASTEWLKYIDAMMSEDGYALGYNKSVVLTLKRTDEKLEEGKELKVLVQGKEVVANENGEYIVTLADYDYITENDEIEIMIQYRDKAGSKFSVKTPADLTESDEMPEIEEYKALTKEDLDALPEAAKTVIYETAEYQFIFVVPYPAVVYQVYEEGTEATDGGFVTEAEWTITLDEAGEEAGHYVRVIDFYDIEGNVVMRYIIVTEVE